MSGLEIGHVFSVETGQMSAVETGCQRYVLNFLIKALDICGYLLDIRPRWACSEMFVAMDIATALAMPTPVAIALALATAMAGDM